MRGKLLLYVPTIHYVNSDMTIPNSLAVPVLSENREEQARRIGLPMASRLPYNSPLVSALGSIPKRKK